MFCDQCGAKTASGSFCVECGTKFESTINDGTKTATNSPKFLKSPLIYLAMLVLALGVGAAISFSSVLTSLNSDALKIRKQVESLESARDEASSAYTDALFDYTMCQLSYTNWGCLLYYGGTEASLRLESEAASSALSSAESALDVAEIKKKANGEELKRYANYPTISLGAGLAVSSVLVASRIVGFRRRR